MGGPTRRPKPEHMTHLDHRTLVPKDHPRIAFRGWIDRLESELLLCAFVALGEGYPTLAAELEETLDYVRRLIRADVLGETAQPPNLCGYTADELREFSHYPERQFGQSHFLASPADGLTLLQVNRLRTLMRQAELAGYRAFRGYDGRVSRPDVMLAMNRLSSLCWIWMIRLKAGLVEREGVPPCSL